MYLKAQQRLERVGSNPYTAVGLHSSQSRFSGFVPLATSALLGGASYEALKDRMYGVS